jgi:glucose/arabinose dehydrogenase
MLRIEPLTNGRPGYRIPPDNPFRGDPEALPEIWAYGLRNPQRFSWDPAGRRDLLIADIGQANVEEINLGRPGANYGWRRREGTFVLSRRNPTRVRDLPKNDERRGFTYPVLQFDHDVSTLPGGPIAVTGGFVYRGKQITSLVGHYLFADLVSGRIFHVPVRNIIEGRQARFRELMLTAEGRPVRLLDLMDAGRVDLRFGQDERGEIYLLTKQDGMIRRLVPTTPAAPPAASDAG